MRNISRKNSCSSFAPCAGEEDTKTRLERNGNGGSPKSFYFGPRFLSRAAPPQSGTRGFAVCKFFGMSARACNNFMEISSPAKYSRSHRVSRAGDATRCESKNVAGEKKKSSVASFFFSLCTAIGDAAFVPRYIEKGTHRLSRIHQRLPDEFFFFLFRPPFLSSPPGPVVTGCITATRRNAMVADSGGNVRLLHR